jgi:hypothetical protein
MQTNADIPTSYWQPTATLVGVELNERQVSMAVDVRLSNLTGRTQSRAAPRSISRVGHVEHAGPRRLDRGVERAQVPRGRGVGDGAAIELQRRVGHRRFLVRGGQRRVRRRRLHRGVVEGLVSLGRRRVRAAAGCKRGDQQACDRPARAEGEAPGRPHAGRYREKSCSRRESIRGGCRAARRLQRSSFMYATMSCWSCSVRSIGEISLKKRA